MAFEPSLRLGTQVGYTGEDLPEVQVWRGHPGLVVDVEPAGGDASVSLVGGPSMSFPLTELEPLDAATFRSRGERIMSGRHPLEDREVGSPITADGFHWT